MIKESNPMDDTQGTPTRVEGVEYPVEFEMRVIYLADCRDELTLALERTLTERGAALERPRELPAKGAKYGRLACRVRFDDQESLYAAYAAIGELPGVKAAL
ncbi:MAG TPA: DUF493 family protein [Spirochaetales bacterium]|nr:DUF493 family protein [Spirochaetales bacterium]